MTHRLFMKDYVTRAAMTLLLALMTTASAWADDAGTLIAIQAVVDGTVFNATPQDGPIITSGGTVTATGYERNGICEYLEIVVHVEPADGYMTALSLIKDKEGDNYIPFTTIIDGTGETAREYTPSDPASMNDAFGRARDIKVYSKKNAMDVSIQVEFVKKNLLLENGLASANVKFYTSASKPTTSFISGISTTAQAKTAKAGEYVVMYIEPTAGLWTNEVLLNGEDYRPTPLGARQRMRATPATNTVTLLQAAEGKYNGEGWYYYQIPEDHSISAGYTRSTIMGTCVNKFDLSTITKDDVTINSTTGIATATLTAQDPNEDFTFVATLALNTSFTYDGTTASIVPTFSGTISVKDQPINAGDPSKYNIQLTPSEQIEVTNSSLSYTATTVTGTVTLKATTTGCFTGEKSGSESIPFTINKKKVTTGDGSSTSSDATLTIEVEDKKFVYNGAAHTPTITVKDGTTTLAQGADKDFTVSYSNNVNAGEATITLNRVSTSFYDVSGTAKFTISPKPLMATVTADNKPYNGSETATVAATVTTGITGQTLAIGGLTGTFAKKDAGTGLTVTVDATKATVTPGESTTKATNYDITYPTATANITARDIVVSGITAEDKPYDGTTTATLKYTNASYGDPSKNQGLITGDELTVTAVGAFANKDVDYDATTKAVIAKEVTISELTLSGASATNYQLASTGQQAMASAKINPKEATLTWTPSPATFTYSQNKAQAPTATAGGLIIGEECEVTVGVTAKEGSSLTDGKAVDTGNYTATATGLSSSNYKLPANASCDFTITSKDVIVGGDAGNIQLDGQQPGDYNPQYDAQQKQPKVQLNDENGNPIPESEYSVGYSENVNVGIAKVTITNNPGNYNVSGTTHFNIEKADLPINVDDKEKVYGEIDPPFTFVRGTLYGSDKLEGKLTRDAGEDVGTYKINIGTLKLAGNTGINYNIKFAGGKLTVKPKPASNNNMNGLTVTQTYKDYEPVPILTVKDGNTPLTKGTDYTLSYKDKDGKPVTEKEMKENPGEYVAVITLIGNYTGEITEDIIVKSLGITITPKNDWFTFSNDVDVTLPDGLTAYTCLLDPSGQSIAVLYYLIPDDKLKVNNQRVVKGGNGILLHGKAGTKYMFKFASETPVNDVKQDYGTTQLIPVVKPTHFKKGDIYVLNSNQFFPITESSTEVPANRAVLKLPAGATAARVLMLVDSGTTGVSEELRVNSEEFATAQWYTLDGRKLDAMPTRKGVYIMNGRKVVIK